MSPKSQIRVDITIKRLKHSTVKMLQKFLHLDSPHSPLFPSMNKMFDPLCFRLLRSNTGLNIKINDGQMPKSRKGSHLSYFIAVMNKH